MNSNGQRGNWDPNVENTNTRIEYFGNEPNPSIYIGNIPSGLDENGLSNLLLACAGKPLAIRMREDDRGRLFAHADFSSVRAVTKAIQDLNGKPPLNLRVEIPRSAKNRSQGRTAGKEEVPPTFIPPTIRPPSQYQPPPTFSVGRGALRRATSIHRAYKAHMQTRKVVDPAMWSTGPADVYNVERYMWAPRNAHEEVNLELLNSLEVIARSDGRRIVSMGRGYYVYPKRRPLATKVNPPEYAKGHQNFHTVSNGVYSYGKDVEVPALPCLFCKTPTVKKCGECGGPYCSEDCQSRDWNNHRTQCKLKLCIDVVPDTINGDIRSISLRPLSDQIITEVRTHPEMHLSSCTRASMIDVMRENGQVNGAIQIAKCVQYPKAIYGTLCCFAGEDALTRLVTNLPAFFDNSPPVTDFSPEKGSMVAIWYQNSWWRGVVVTAPSANFDVYRVGLTELAKIVTSKKCDLRPLPAEFAELPELGVKGTIISSCVQEVDLWSTYFQVDSSIQVHLESAEGSTITCNVKSEDNKVNLCRMQLQRWDPEAQLKERPVVTLTPKCRVVLTCYHNQSAIFVRPTGKQHVELRNTVLQQVAASYTLGAPLNRPPRRDEMVACMCEEDGTYYRAIVRDAIDNVSKYKVWFVDFGNFACVSIKDMKVLPEDVKNYQFLAVRIALKGVSDHKLTVRAAEYLNNLLDKEEVLTVDFENSMNDGVELTTRDGTSVNAKLNLLLQPSWKISSDDNTNIYGDKVYMFEDLVPLSLIEDDKNEAPEISVIVLHVNEDEGALLCCPANSPVVPAVITSLNAQIDEFCDSPVSDISYNPRKHEVCLARHPDGSWQRALAVESIDGGARVVFLDFGGTQNVLFRDIRRIIPDFMSMPTLISSCLIQGLPAKLTDAIKGQLKELIKVDSIIKVQNVRLVEDSMEYNIELPDIIGKLRARQLL